jgi:hypothetical protein
MEEWVNKGRAGGKPKSGERGRTIDPIVHALEEELRNALGTRVLLRKGRKGKGVIEVPFLSPEDFERVFLLLTGKEASDVLE